MKTPRLLAGVIASFFLTAAGMLPVSAELPMLDNPPWLGYYAVFANKQFQITLTREGKLALIPLQKNGGPVAKQLEIPIDIIIEEIMPDGKTTVKQLKPESLESAQPPTVKLEKAVVRGKVTGDASFEVTLEQTRGVISLGGRVLDPGTLKNPLRFSLRVRFPSAYDIDKAAEKKDAKAFAKKFNNDRIDLKWTDKTRKKIPFDKPVDASAAEFNGPGIATAEVEIDAYKGHKFIFNVSQNSAMSLTNGKTALHEGFTIQWLADAAKDPDGKARLLLDVK